MTYRELLKIVNPEFVSAECAGCPGSYFIGGPDTEACHCNTSCTECWDREATPDQARAALGFLPWEELDMKPIEAGNKIDIHELVDKVLREKKCSISIHIFEDGTTVSIAPFVDEKNYWIPIPSSRRGFKCSSCGINSERPSTYCPACGEKMSGIKEDLNDE